MSNSKKIADIIYDGNNIKIEINPELEKKLVNVLESYLSNDTSDDNISIPSQDDPVDEDKLTPRDKKFKHFLEEFDRSDSIDKLYLAGKYEEAVCAFKTEFLNHLRHTWFSEIARMGSLLHPNYRVYADRLIGRMSKSEYQDHKNFKYVDLYGLSDNEYPPKWMKENDYSKEFNWYVKPPKDTKGREEYFKWLFAMGLVTNFWREGNVPFVMKWVQITADFCRNHYDKVHSWDEDKFDEYKGAGLYDCRWNDQASSSFGQAKRIMHMMKSMAAFCKRDTVVPFQDKDDKFEDSDVHKKNWIHAMNEKSGEVQQEILDAFETEAFIDIVHSLIYQHPKAVMNRYSEPGPNANQALAGYESLGMIVKYLGKFHKVQKLKPAIRKMLDIAIGSFHHDGHMVETSLNYNFGDEEALRTLVRMLEPAFPDWAKEATEKLNTWRKVVDSLISPIGLYPQIGNNHLDFFEPPRSDAELKDLQQRVTNAGKKSVCYPYSGYMMLCDPGNSVSRNSIMVELSRKNTGHFTHARNAVQITMGGRPVIVTAGPPFYGRTPTDDARRTEDYFREWSTYKVNTVLVDGKVQSHEVDSLKQAAETPVGHKWLSNSTISMVEGYYPKEYGYGSHINKRGQTEKELDDVTHIRKVVMLHKLGMIFIIDLMDSDKKHEYSALWHYMGNEELQELSDEFKDDQEKLEDALKKYGRKGRDVWDSTEEFIEDYKELHQKDLDDEYKDDIIRNIRKLDDDEDKVKRLVKLFSNLEDELEKKHKKKLLKAGFEEDEVIICPEDKKYPGRVSYTNDKSGAANVRTFYLSNEKLKLKKYYKSKKPVAGWQGDQGRVNGSVEIQAEWEGKGLTHCITAFVREDVVKKVSSLNKFSLDDNVRVYVFQCDKDDRYKRDSVEFEGEFILAVRTNDNIYGVAIGNKKCEIRGHTLTPTKSNFYFDYNVGKKLAVYEYF